MMAGLDCRLREGRTGGVLLDPETQARVTRLLMIGTGRAVFLARRLVGLLRDFDDAGVRALALKGPALARALYGRVDFRPSDDLDVWVHPRDFQKACGMMEDRGFVPLVALSPVEAVAHMRAGWDRGFRSPAGDYVVELATGIAPGYFARAPDPESFWAEAGDMELEGGSIRIPAPESLFELLCMHGTKHNWSRLLWVADVATLAGPRCGIDREKLDRRVRRNGTLWMTSLGAGLARSLLGAGIPRPAAPHALERRAIGFLSGEASCSGFRDEWRFHCAARERWRDRIRYVALALLTPGFGDWRWIALPPRLFWLHWIFRPFRGLCLIVKNRVAGL